MHTQSAYPTDVRHPPLLYSQRHAMPGLHTHILRRVKPTHRAISCPRLTLPPFASPRPNPKGETRLACAPTPVPSASHLGTQLGAERSISQVAKRFIGTGTGPSPPETPDATPHGATGGPAMPAAPPGPDPKEPPAAAAAAAAIVPLLCAGRRGRGPPGPSAQPRPPPHSPGGGGAARTAANPARRGARLAGPTDPPQGGEAGLGSEP